MTTRYCARCGRDAGDAYLDPTCLAETAKVAAGIGELLSELETTKTGVRGIDYRTLGNPGSSDSPDPVNWGSVNAKRKLLDTLGNLGSLIRLPYRESAAELVEEFMSAVDSALCAIDRPPSRTYLGPCDIVECAGGLYESEGAGLAYCDTCRTGTDSGLVRGRLVADLEDRVVTAAEIGRLSTYLGLRGDRDTIRKRVTTWGRRGRLASVTDGPPAAYRFGDAYALLVQSEVD